ncbi:class I SAM-dependent methyltransferase [Ruegeria sp. 2012CJ41-6]|uniref:Class I SAM-dependent methyltransferase n=1 Tax=Ruegeria spongiae TaxID=2942209 RepID=A0ABT0PWE3_9RHOB|nr:class I SAM-dependent methyltransferase [Ruegeria spongiae]MCL6281921.1 class I SAM-dependent methyltransferase [Ruegeria spongiae]
MDWEAFFTLHHDLPREGPGAPEDVDWVLDETGLTGAVSVCDAGCGPGGDLETLADRLPEAYLTGIEMQAGFVATAARRCARFGDRVQVRQGDMAEPGGPHDLIWCAGALYFLGVTEGLKSWRSALAPGGFVAFSEPVKLQDEVPQAAQEFWQEYPAITDLSGIAARVDAAGYDVLGHRLIVGQPWENYYAPLRRRIAELRAANPDPALVEMLDMNAREAALWEAASDHIAYALMLVRPR